MNLQNTNQKKYIFIGGTGVILLLAIFFLLISPSHKSVTAIADDASTDETGLLDQARQPENIKVYQKKIQYSICSQLDSASLQAYFLTEDVRSYVYQSMISFYRQRGCQPAWVSRQGPMPVSDSLISILQTAPQEGLRYNYHLEELQEAREEIAAVLTMSNLDNPDSTQLARIMNFDFLMTASYFTYASHLLSGKVDPDQFDITWRAEPRRRNLAPLLEEALEKNQISRSLKNVIPSYPQYEKLRQALVRYQTIENQGGWPVIPATATLKRGDAGKEVALLKQRLAATNDLSASFAEDTIHIFNSTVEEAVKHFQRRNGLRADGIAGKNTLALLNTSVEKRIEKIRINLERLRWLPDTLGEHYVMVNIPDYRVSVIENGQPVLKMKVVVGKEYASTPVFSDEIQYLEFSPTWTVPLSIAREEILPKIKRDPGYLENKNYLLYSSWHSDNSLVDPYKINWANVRPEDFNYRLVKQPGPNNPLGQVKFMFPNDLAIYLHDTPSEHLFDRKKRAYSHGCVRVEKPIDLALHLLKDVPEVDHTNIYDYLYLEEPKAIPLPEPVPIKFMYLTAFVDEEGTLNFRKDIYGHDSLQIQALL